MNYINSNTEVSTYNKTTPDIQWKRTRVIVIGDDKQLPPPSNDYVATSLFRSILQYFDSTLLRKEYRFNKDILDLINPYYDNKLVADDSVSNISTADIAEKDYNGINSNLRKILLHDKKIVFVDTNDERREDRHFVNTGEVAIIKDIVEGCQSMGIKRHYGHYPIQAAGENVTITSSS